MYVIEEKSDKIKKKNLNVKRIERHRNSMYFQWLYEIDSEKQNGSEERNSIENPTKSPIRVGLRVYSPKTKYRREIERND